jgi:hypothetical protein
MDVAMRSNPYLPPQQSSIETRGVATADIKTFRWQVIPATFSYLAATAFFGIAILFVLGWIEYVNSDRYDGTRSFRWTILETLRIPVFAGAGVFAVASGWAWTRHSAMTAVRLFLLSFLVLILGWAVMAIA